MDKSNFSERLKELMFENELNAEQLADAVGVSRTTAYRWTKEPLQIKRDSLIAVADYFECTIEFLIGRSYDDRKIKANACPNFAKQVRKIMKEKNISTYKFERTGKFKCSYLNDWEKGYQPVIQTLIELSEYFGCTIDYLVGRE